MLALCQWRCGQSIDARLVAALDDAPDMAVSHDREIASAFLWTALIDSARAEMAAKRGVGLVLIFSTMDRIAEELAALADADLDRITAVIDALTDGLPEPLTSWVHHLVDHERDGRAGVRYPLRPPSDALEPHEYPGCIEAARRLRDSSIDLPLTAMLGAVIEALGDFQARHPARGR